MYEPPVVYQPNLKEAEAALSTECAAPTAIRTDSQFKLEVPRPEYWEHWTLRQKDSPYYA